MAKSQYRVVNYFCERTDDNKQMVVTEKVNNLIKNMLKRGGNHQEKVFGLK